MSPLEMAVGHRGTRESRSEEAASSLLRSEAIDARVEPLSEGNEAKRGDREVGASEAYL